MATLVCPNCKNTIQEYDIQSETIPCEHCQFDVNIKAGLTIDLPNTHKISKVNDGIIIQQSSSQLEVQLIWKHFSNWKFSLYFGIALSIFAVGILFLIAGNSFFGSLICGVILLLGCYLMYLGFFQLTNITHIQINQQKLSVHQGMTNRVLHQIPSIPIAQIDQIYVKRKSAGSSNSKNYYNHEIWLKTKTGEEHVLVSQIKEAAFAYSIENSIEEFLNIVDQIQLNEFHPMRSPLDQVERAKLQAATILAKERSDTGFFTDKPIPTQNLFKAKCPKCKAEIPPKDINVAKELVFCTSCQETFSLLDTAKLLPDNLHKDFEAPPKGVKVLATPNHLTISFLNNNKSLLLALFPAMFIFFFYNTWFVIFALLMTYFVVIVSIKKQTFRVTNLYLWVDVFPNWYFGTKSTNYKIETIKQVFVVRRVVKTSDTTRTVFDLKFLDHYNAEHILLGDYKRADHLFYVETQIETILKIKDERVTGEYEPGFRSRPQNFSELRALVKKGLKMK